MEESLAGALQILGVVHTPREARERAAAIVLKRVGSWAFPYLRRVYAARLSRSAQFGPDEVRELFSNAVEETVLVAIRGMFRGGSERGAHAWCKVIMRRYISRQLRRDFSRPMLVRTTDEVERGFGVQPTAGQGNLSSLVVLLRREIQRACRPRDTESVLHSFDSYLETMTRVQCVAQTQKMSPIGTPFPAPPPEASNRRVLATIYQRRRRGRIAAQRALRALQSSEEWDLDLAQAATLLGLHERVRNLGGG